MNLFHFFFYCFYCWVWIGNCLLGSNNTRIKTSDSGVTLKAENVALIRSCVKFCLTYATYSSCDFQYAFLGSFFSPWLFSNWDTLKTKKTLKWGMSEIRNKRGSYSKLLLVDINEFLIYLYKNKFVNQNNGQSISSHIIIYLIAQIFFFSFLTHSKRSLMPLVDRTLGLDRLEDFFFLDLFFCHYVHCMRIVLT